MILQSWAPLRSLISWNPMSGSSHWVTRPPPRRDSSRSQKSFTFSFPHFLHRHAETLATFDQSWDRQAHGNCLMTKLSCCWRLKSSVWRRCELHIFMIIDWCSQKKIRRNEKTSLYRSLKEYIAMCLTYSLNFGVSTLTASNIIQHKGLGNNSSRKSRLMARVSCNFLRWAPKLQPPCINSVAHKFECSEQKLHRKSAPDASHEG